MPIGELKPMPPLDNQVAADALKHVNPDRIAGAVGWIIASLATLVAVLFGWDRGNTKRSVSALFRWKDDVVDPVLKEFPEKYVLARVCDRRHNELLAEIRDSRKEQREEMKHFRRLLEGHLGVNGGGAGP